MRRSLERVGRGASTSLLIASSVVATAVTAVLAVGGGATAYADSTSGFLRVTSSPAVVSRVVVDGVVRSDWGLDWLTVPAGDHTVCFSDVPGFATPPCEDIVVGVGTTTVVVGVFSELGLLKVDVSPAGLASTVFVDGKWRDEYGLFSFVEPGVHTVCWGDVPGFQAPTCADVTVSGGAQSTIQGDFVVSGSPTPGPAPDLGSHGLLRVTSSPAVASRIVVDGVARGDWGLSWVKVPIGSHEVCFTDVPGFATPSCEAVTVTDGETTSVTGTFVPLGLLKVDVDPAGLGVDVVVGGVPRNQFGLYFFVEPGSYEVCGTTSAGWVTPVCATVDVTANTQTDTTLTYLSS